MENKQNHEELNEILNRNIAWIENCDSKASIIISGIGVVISIILATDYVTKFHEIYEYMIEQNQCLSYFYLILWGISILSIIVGSFLLFRVLIPRIDPKEYSNRGIQQESLLYFSSISKFKTLSAYKQKLVECTADKMQDDLISQIYICSLICDKKFKNYKYGLFITLTGFSLFMALAIIGFILSK